MNMHASIIRLRCPEKREMRIGVHIDVRDEDSGPTLLDLPDRTGWRIFSVVWWKARVLKCSALKFIVGSQTRT